MILKAVRFANLFLTGVLTGNEFGGLVGFHPALYRLPTEAHASAEQEITARFGRVMPPFMIAAIVSFVPVSPACTIRAPSPFTAIVVKWTAYGDRCAPIRVDMSLRFSRSSNAAVTGET